MQYAHAHLAPHTSTTMQLDGADPLFGGYEQTFYDEYDDDISDTQLSDDNNNNNIAAASAAPPVRYQQQQSQQQQQQQRYGIVSLNCILLTNIHMFCCSNAWT